jgi:hypothetical protein
LHPADVLMMMPREPRDLGPMRVDRGQLILRESRPRNPSGRRVSVVQSMESSRRKPPEGARRKKDEVAKNHARSVRRTRTLIDGSRRARFYVDARRVARPAAVCLRLRLPVDLANSWQTPGARNRRSWVRAQVLAPSGLKERATGFEPATFSLATGSGGPDAPGHKSTRTAQIDHLGAVDVIFDFDADGPQIPPIPSSFGELMANGKRRITRNSHRKGRPLPDTVALDAGSSGVA